MKIDLLISMGSNKHALLVRAALAGDEFAVDLLISKGADVTRALEYVAIVGNEAAVDLLISKRADVTMALAHAAETGNEAAVDLLIDKGANKDIALYYAADANNQAAVSLLIGRGADGYGVLANAITAGNEAAIWFLIHNGVDINIALYYAADANNQAAVSLLIGRGADVYIALGYAYEAQNEDSDGEMIYHSTLVRTEGYTSSAVNILENYLPYNDLYESDNGEVLLVESSYNGDDHGPDSGSGAVIQVGVRRSLAITDEEGQEMDIASSSGDHSSSSSSSSEAVKTGDAGNNASKRANLSNEASSEEKQNSAVKHYKQEKENSSVIKTILDNLEAPKTQEEEDLESAESAAKAILNGEDATLDIVKVSNEFHAQDAFDSEHVPETANEKQVAIHEDETISGLYQLGKCIYDFISNSLNSSPLIFADKSNIGIFSSSYDYGLPKLDMDSHLFDHTNEAL